MIDMESGSSTNHGQAFHERVGYICHAMLLQFSRYLKLRFVCTVSSLGRSRYYRAITEHCIWVPYRDSTTPLVMMMECTVWLCSCFRVWRLFLWGYRRIPLSDGGAFSDGICVRLVRNRYANHSAQVVTSAFYQELTSCCGGGVVGFLRLLPFQHAVSPWIYLMQWFQWPSLSRRAQGESRF